MTRLVSSSLSSARTRAESSFTGPVPRLPGCRLDPKGTGQTRWTTGRKPALNAFAVTFADRMPAAENL